MLEKILPQVFIFEVIPHGMTHGKIVLFSLFPLLGCPYGHTVLNHTSRTADNILTDMCSDKDDNDWTVKEDAANSTEASVTINLAA